MTRRLVLLAAATAVAARFAAVATAQLAERPIDGVLAHPAIAYFAQPTADAVADLARRVASGDAHLAFDEGSGYLRAVLEALHVPVQSQMLVMSKTGVQGLHTDPRNPRAIYFNDFITVGYIRGAPLLELAVQDPRQGTVFYTIDQKPQPRPAFDRPRACLACHQVYSSLHVPGLIARSSFVAPDGLPLGQFGTFDADDRTPFRRRWGGWYVTGTHGTMRHMGNAVVTNRDEPESAISERTLNRASLEGAFDPRTYPSAHSDIVALMVFQHQAHMTNLITRTGWEARVAAHEQRLDLGRGPVRDAIGELVDYLLFVDEQPLTDRIVGTSGFAEAFAARGPFDSRGRSLRQLDLSRRLLRYPCSYMIYSAAFSALPPELRRAIFDRVAEILSGRDANPKYARLTDADRRAVAEILRDTIVGMRDGFAAGLENSKAGIDASRAAARRPAPIGWAFSCPESSGAPSVCRRP